MHRNRKKAGVARILCAVLAVMMAAPGGLAVSALETEQESSELPLVYVNGKGGDTGEDPKEPESSDNDRTGTVIAGSVEEMQSPHDYLEDMDKTWIFTLPGAEYLRFTFSSDSSLENGYDYLRVENSSGEVLRQITGSEISGMTLTVPGDTLRLHLITDSTNCGYGFRVTEITEGRAEDDVTTLNETVIAEGPEQMKLEAPVSSGMEKLWTYDLGSYGTYAVTFDESTAMPLDEEGNPTNKDNYFIVSGREEDNEFISGMTYTGNELAGQTVLVTGRRLGVFVKTVTEGCGGFAVTSVRNIVSTAESAEDLHGEYAENAADNILNYDTGIESGWVAVTFSDDSVIECESDSEHGDLSGDTLCVNGRYLRDIGGKTFLFNARELSFESHITCPGSCFKVESVTDAVLVTEDVSLMKSQPSVDNNRYAVYCCELPEEQEQRECIRVTFSDDTVLAGGDELKIDQYTFTGDSLAGKSLTLLGDSLRITADNMTTPGSYFEILSIVPGNQEDIYAESDEKEIGNDLIRVNASYNCTEGGRFSVFTTGGDPFNDFDNEQKLLYNGSSRSTVRIDGEDILFGNGYYGIYMADNADMTISAAQKFGVVSVRQEFSIEKNTSTDREDVVRIAYTYTNNDTQPHSVGLRIGLDTMLGENDKAPFRIPGTGDVTTQTEFRGAEIPDYWQAFDSLTEPSIIAQGSFTRDTKVIPDRVRFGRYESLTDSLWDGEFTPGEPNDDSAVFVFWENRTIVPGESITFSTYYGLSQLSQSDESLMPPLALSMYGDRNAAQTDYNYETGLPVYDETVFTAYLNNIGKDMLEDTQVSIILPEGIGLAEGCEQTVTFSSIKTGEIKQADWRLVIDPEKIIPGEDYYIRIEAVCGEDVKRIVGSRLHIPSTLSRKVDISDAVIRPEEETVTYTGSELRPLAVFYGKGEDMNRLVEGSNYTIVYENNINAGKAKATVTGIGMFEGTVEVEFDILPQDISELEMTTDEVLPYIGTQHTPFVTLGEGLSRDDFRFEYGENTNAGTGTVTVTSVNPNYTGEKVIVFRIIPKHIFGAALTPMEFTVYKGKENYPHLKFTDAGRELVEYTGDNIDTADYYCDYNPNAQPGILQVTVFGLNNYCEYIYFIFNIVPKDVSGLTAVINKDTFVYSGSPCCPTVTVTDGDNTLMQNRDYKLSYSNNTDVGTGTVTITGCGEDYTGTVTLDFSITPKSVYALTAAVSPTSVSYTGSALKPALIVKDGSRLLTAGKDYTLSYSDNVKVGKATVKITGKGNYTGTRSLNFTIKGKSVSELKATLSSTSYTYSGAAKKPTVTVKDGTKTLKLNTDYTVSYSNNINAGTATAKITGKGNYAGTKSISYTIKKKSISSMTVTLSTTLYNYTGKARKPAVTVKNGTSVLVKDKDFTVSYANCTKPGKASVTITATGNYSGKIVKNYTIRPGKMEIKTLAAVNTSTSAKKLNVTWAKDTKVDGYQIAYATKSNFSDQKKKTISGNASTFTSLTGLSRKTVYYVRIRAYKVIDGEKVYGSYGTVKSIKTT